jgi:hypothetical protein
MHPESITSSPFPHSPQLTARQIVAAILSLEGRRVDLVRAGQPVGDGDYQLRRASARLVHAEYSVPPRGLR